MASKDIKTSAKKEQQDRDKKVLLSKDYIKNNPIFTNDHILEFYDLFNLYSDPRTHKVDLRDILTTARTLGLHARYQIVFRAIEELETELDGVDIDFENFIKALTTKMGNPFNEEGRRSLWDLIDMEKKEYLTAEDLKYISNELRYNLTDDDINEVIHNVAGYENDSISYEKFEKYLSRKIHKRQIEAELLKQ